MIDNCPIDLKSLGELKALLHRIAPKVEVLAYGSRITGKSHAGSDLDLVVRNPQNPEQPVSFLPSLKSALTESNLPMLVDVQDWALLPSSFRSEIEKNFIHVQKPAL